MNKINILVTGGAGYIGSHVVKMLIKSGHNVSIIDDLSTGNAKLINPAATFYKNDLKSSTFIDEIFSKEKFDAVMHFAAYSVVEESMINPKKYFLNNIVGSLNLFNAMLNSGVKKIIFSSTAAVYGNPIDMPITEETACHPLHSYGLSKSIVENILQEFDKAYGLKSISLRYFNAAGASSDREIGEIHNPETHLIPLILKTAKGELKSIKVFGTDYDTKDKTCVRDYVHVEDIADGHILALGYLEKNNQTNTFNLGSSRGYSVREVINEAKKITGIDFCVEEAARRGVEPAALIADSTRAQKELGWHPKRSLEEIIKSAWLWEKNQV